MRMCSACGAERWLPDGTAGDFCAACELLRAGAGGIKGDVAKPRWDLLPWEAAESIVAVLTYGAKKYAPDNWRRVDGGRWRYYGAALRHLVAWWRGERVDPESGLHHLAHAGCCVLFLLALDMTEEKP